MSAADPDPDLEILREAERRRGGCGAFLAGMITFLLIFFGLWWGDMALARTLPAGWDRYFGMFYVGRLVLGIAGAIGAAKLFTRIRLRISGRDRSDNSHQ